MSFKVCKITGVFIKRILETCIRKATIFQQLYLVTYTLKQISNWQPCYFHILGKVLGEKYK